MRLLSLVLIFIACLAAPARADAAADALEDAFAAFERALPGLTSTEFGVEVAAYRDALTFHRFRSTHWGGEIAMEVEVRGAAEGSCSRYAAFVRLPPENGTIALVICPQFMSGGTPELRRLTILHELVHVVAGPNECRAMAFAARVEMLATGAFTPVDRYWAANNCSGSAFRLP